MIRGLGRSPGEGKGLPTPVFWPGEFHGLYSPWGRKESDTTERLSFSPSSLREPSPNRSSVTVLVGFPGSSAGKEPACKAGDPGLIPESGRSTGEGIGYPLQYSWTSLVAQMVQNLPAMWETWVQSLGWEDPGGGHGNPLQYACLEISMDRNPVGYSPCSLKELDMTEQLTLSLQPSLSPENVHIAPSVCLHLLYLPPVE